MPSKTALLLISSALSLFLLAEPAQLLSAETSSLPAPESVLGFPVGADFQLATYEESLEYFRRLEGSSDLLRLVEVGRTSQGRPWYLALISSSQNLAQVEHYREIAFELAHPQGLTDPRAHQLSREGRAFVDISGGLHASEAAGAQHTIQLAYDLVSGREDPRIEAILDNVILLLWPSLNPDGQDIVVNWYRSNLGTSYEVSPMVQLYQEYVGHDNNRDAYMLNMIESRVISRTWRHWEPQIIYVHHQTSPFPTRIWLPPFAEPIASQAPALMSRTVNLIGMVIAEGLESKGLVGATHMGTGFDAWYPGYVDYLPMLQNRAAFWTETALYHYATPHFYSINDFPEKTRDLRTETLYASPWKGGWWRLKDAVDYMLTASLSVLDYAAKYKEDVLYNRYQSGRNTIRKYRQEPPYAYFVPQDQRDPVAAVEMLRRLAFNGIRVAQLTEDVTLDGVTHRAGSWVIPMDQEFAELARQVLDVQSYPDLREYPEGPPEQPYDAAGWTLPYQMDVRVIEARAPLTGEIRAAMRVVQGTAVKWGEREGGNTDRDATVFDSVPGIGFDTDPAAAAIRPPEGSIVGSGPILAVDPAQNNAFRALNRGWKTAGKVYFQPAVRSEKGEQPGGRYLIAGIPAAEQLLWTKELALRSERTRLGQAPLVRQASIALYQPWRPSIDEGWSRWLLERYGFELKTVTSSNFRPGLLKHFGVIVLPAESPRTLLKGYPKGAVSPRYEGGIGAVGVRALDTFVRDGGTLVCLNQSSDFAIQQLHLPVKNVVADLKRKDFFSRGSILEVEVDVAHPVMAGMPARAKIFVDRSPAFTTLEGFEGVGLAKYGKVGNPLLSGYLLGEKYLRGLAAALDVHHGSGHVILLGFRPQWRGQPFGTFRVLFNAVLYTGPLAEGEYGTPDFWSPPEPEKSTAKEEKPKS
ncbi:MAG: M14 metallopeptidase family protein [Acidobacteriota bacterium]